MTIEFYYPRWGSENINWDTFLKKIKEAGFDGVEYALARNVSKEELINITQKINEYELKLILQHYDTADANFEKHHKAYIQWLEFVKHFDVVKINSQTGKDFFSFDQNNHLLKIAQKFEIENGVEICHETHRNKFSFACHITKPFLEFNPELKITLDVSHWVAVAESYLEDQKETLNIVLSHTEHIHARVGHTQGPQVTDPRAPEWREALNHHLVWWDKIIERKKLNNNKTVTITTEFGPFPYMVHHPETNQPIASQWDNNVYMMKLLKERYKNVANTNQLK